ncbi:hypothetical protein TNCV_3897261 [Trichonephila clavipes]|nr:hypothetical protein TNCV_3897261 [Trichonephila clavipes]
MLNVEHVDQSTRSLGNPARRGGRRDDQGSLRKTRLTNRRASSLSEFGNKTGKVEMRSEGRRAQLLIGRAARLLLEERVTREVVRVSGEK